MDVIRNYGSLLASLLNVPEADFLKNPDVYLKAERCLQVVIQAMLDVGSHIISDRQFRHPDQYQDIFVILAESRVVSTELAGRLRGLAGLRNILVHAYLDLDRARLREMIRERLHDVEEYATQVLDFVDRAGSA
jgi:uncharacterized protein YutE (UPF0331/DUF86 family)